MKIDFYHMPAKLKFTLIAALALLAVPGLVFASAGEINSASPGAERILITSDGGLVVYSADGQMFPGFPVWAEGVFEGNPLAGDFDGAVGNEIAIVERKIGNDYSLRLYDNAGAELSSTVLPDYAANVNSVTLYNYISKKYSVIYSTTQGNVKEISFSAGAWSDNLLIAGSGTEAFLSTDSGKILIYYAPSGGSQIKVYKKTAGWNLLKTIDVAAVVSQPIVDDGNGRLWFLSDDKLYSYSANGDLPAGFPVTLSAKGIDLLVADIDKNNAGLEAGVRFNDGRLALYDYQGQLLKDRFIKEKFSAWQALTWEREQGIFTYSFNNTLSIKHGFVLDETSVLNAGFAPLFFQSINFTSSTSEIDPKSIPPDPVTGLTVAGGTEIVILTWDAYIDNYGDFNRFEIYRSNDPETLLAELPPIATTTDMATTSYIDNVPAGTYYYLVAAVDNDENLTGSGLGPDGSWLGPVVVNAPKYPELALNYTNNDVSNNAAIDLGAVVVNTVVSLEFTIANQGDADLLLTGNPLVNITGADIGEFSVELLPTQILEPTVTSTFIIRFTPKTVGDKSATINIANNDSDENPFTFNLVANVYDAAPLPVAGVSVSSTVNSISLFWNAYQDLYGDFSHFNIYRSTSPLAAFSPATLLASVSNIADISYQDTTTVSGEPYYYAISAVDLGGLESTPSGWVGPISLLSPPLLQLSFDEPGNSSAFADASSYQHQAYCATPDTCPESGAVGRIDKALKFNGDDYLIIDHSSALQPKWQMTVSAWVKPSTQGDSLSSYMTVANKFLKYELNVNQQGGVSAGITNEAGERVVLSTGKLINLEQWSHIAMTYDGSLIKIYVNGELKASKAQTGAIGYAPNYLKVGSYNNNYYFNGLIDELRVYDWALGAVELKAEYDSAPPVSAEILENRLWLPFDETANMSVFTDTSGFNNKTYCANPASCPFSGQTGRVNKALQFDGLDDYLIIDHSDALQPSKEITVSAWVKPFASSTLTNYMTVVNKFLKYELNVNQQGGVSAGITNEAGQRVVLHTGKVLNLNQWNFVAMTYDGQDIKIYVNGELKASKNQTGLIGYASRYLKIGHYNNRYYFYGLIDELKVYNGAMSPEELKAEYDKAADSKEERLSLSFDEGPGALVFVDSSFYTQPAYCFDALSCPASGLIGKTNQALQFDGLNDYLTVDHSDALQPKKEITVSAWVKPFASSTMTSYMTVANKFLKYELNVNQQGGLSAGITNEAGQRVVLHAGKVISLDQWSFITMTYDGQNIKIYVNGELKAAKPQTGAIGSVPRYLKIGHYNNKYHFYGLIDELKIYNYALTAAEVADAYEL